MSLTEPVLGMPETIKEEASDDDDDGKFSLHDIDSY